jgi:hypothetical protein
MDKDGLGTSAARGQARRELARSLEKLAPHYATEA